MKYHIFLFSLISLLFVIGCGLPTSPVSGKVTFEDGTPLTSGEVVFALNNTEEYFAKGKINSDGTYSLAEHVIGKASGKSGCRHGEFTVFIGGTSTTAIVDNKTITTHAIDENYTRRDKTPLNTKVPNGNYDFKVPPYKK
ncbi:MAG: hypothetical protein LBT09_15655 [Planctomycetaceae bacterium]|jgi:hypothetical protein|nr:hypothetical protein [Planctomycetaceae bacterium]